MKFLLRCLLVLAVALVFSAALYYAVRALPGGSSTPPPGVRLQPVGGRSEPDRSAPRPERRENERRGGPGWHSLLQVARRVLMFSALVFVSVIAKNLIFGKRPSRKNSAD